MISRTSIEELIDRTDDLNLTITLPTHKKGEEVQQDPIRFKNLLSEAESQLLEKGMKRLDVEEILKRPRQLLEDYNFWNHADEGMVFYMNRDLYEIYQLPYSLNERVYLRDHFLITPLLPMVSLNGTWAMLALSPKNLRLLRCTRESIENITPGDIFTNIEDFVGDRQEASLQFHSSADSEVMYYGPGSADNERKKLVEKYMRGVEKSVTALMKQMGEPLVLVGSEDIISLYRSLNKYQRLLETPVTRYPGSMKNHELREVGWEVIHEYFLKDMYQALEQFDKEEAGRTSNNLSQIVESTVMGKTDTLFISMNEETWGVYDESEHQVHYSGPNGSTDELLNWTALRAINQGAKVYVLPKQDMPAASTVAALFRF